MDKKTIQILEKIEKGEPLYWQLGNQKEAVQKIRAYCSFKEQKPDQLLESYHKFLKLHACHGRLLDPYFHNPNRDWGKDYRSYRILHEILEATPLERCYKIKNCGIAKSVLLEYTKKLKSYFLDITDQDLAILNQYLLAKPIPERSLQHNPYLHDDKRMFETDHYFTIYGKIIVEQPEDIALKVIEKWNPSAYRVEKMWAYLLQYFLDFDAKDQRLWKERMQKFFASKRDDLYLEAEMVESNVLKDPEVIIPAIEAGRADYWRLGDYGKAIQKIQNYFSDQGQDPSVFLEQYECFFQEHSYQYRLINPYFHDPDRNWDAEKKEILLLKRMTEPVSLSNVYLIRQYLSCEKGLKELMALGKKLFVDLTLEDIQAWERYSNNNVISYGASNFNTYLHDPNRDLLRDDLFVLKAKIMVEMPKKECRALLGNLKIQTAREFIYQLQVLKNMFDDFSQDDQKRWEQYYVKASKGGTKISSIEGKLWTVLQLILKKGKELPFWQIQQQYHITLRLFYDAYQSLLVGILPFDQQQLIEQYISEEQRMLDIVTEKNSTLSQKAAKCQFELCYRNTMYQMVYAMAVLHQSFDFKSYQQMIPLSPNDFLFYYHEWFSLAFSEEQNRFIVETIKRIDQEQYFGEQKRLALR